MPTHALEPFAFAQFGAATARAWAPRGVLLSLLPLTAGASNCFDHYRPTAWGGAGTAIVLCRNSPDFDHCELRADGARIRVLVRHGLDEGRMVFTDRNTPGAAWPYPVEILCSTADGFRDTFQIRDGSVEQYGCCRLREVGPVACCGDNAPPPEPDAGPVEPPPPPEGPSCPPLRSVQFGADRAVLDVSEGSDQRLRYEVDGVPAPAQLTGGVLRMLLFDADHPGEEGRVFVNGGGPLDLPAAAEFESMEVPASLVVPVELLRGGRSVIEFGAGPRDRTHYGVRDVELAVSGPACDAPPPDASVTVDLGPPPDAAPPVPDAATPEVRPSTADAVREPPAPEVGLDPSRDSGPPPFAEAGADATSRRVDAVRSEGGCHTAPPADAPWGVLLVVVGARRQRR